MNLFYRLLGILPLIPAVVQGIEVIHADSKLPGATKKQLALEALGLAQGGAGAIAPELKPQIDAAAEFAGAVIDSTVKMFNVLGWGGHATLPVMPALPAVPVVAPPAAAPIASASTTTEKV